MVDCIPEGIVSQRRSRFEHRPPKATVGSTIAAQAQRFCKLLSLEGVQGSEVPVGSGVGAVTKSWQRRPCNPATPRGVVIQRHQDAQGGQACAIAPCWVDTPRGMQQNGQDAKREIWVEESEAGMPPHIHLDAKSLVRSLPWIVLEEEELSETGSVKSACRTSASFTSPLMAPRRVPKSRCALADQRASRFPVSTAATLLRSSSSRVTSSSPLSTASTFKDEPFTARASASTSAGEAVMNFTEELREKLCTVFQNPGLCGPERGQRKKRLSTGEFVVGESSSHRTKCCSRPPSIDVDDDLEKLDATAATFGKASMWSTREVPVDVMSRQTSRRGGA